MAQRIDVPGMGIVEFPDGMSDEQIVAAIKKNTTPKMPEPEADTGQMQSAMIAAGKSATRIGQGLQQLYYGLKGDRPALDALQQRVVEEQRLYAPLAQRYPITTALGEAVPAMAIPVSGAGGALAIMAKSALAGALPSALSYGSPQERAERSMIGAAGGAGAGGAGVLLSRVLQPLRNVSQASDEAMQAAQRVGFKPSAGQQTGNQALMNFENYLARSPGSSAVMQRAQDANQRALNTAAARSMGESADNLGEATFASAKARIGAEFQRLQDATRPQMGDEFLNALGSIDASNRARSAFADSRIDDLIDRGLELASKGNLDGQAYKEIHTALAQKATTAFRGGDATLGQAYKTVREALDSAAKASLSREDQQAWDMVRKQWTAFKTLSKSNVSEAGDVSAARVAAEVRRKGPQLRTGEVSGDLADIARIGEAFKGVQNPNSGQLVQQALQSPVTGAIVGGAAGGAPGAMAGALGNALFRRLGNNLTAHAYQTPLMQAYMTRGLLEMSPSREAVLLSALRPLGLLGPDYVGGQ